MSRIVPAKELDLIERVISEHPEGDGISALARVKLGLLCRQTVFLDHFKVNGAIRVG